MPVAFLTPGQRERYGRYPAELSASDLACYFHLDDSDRGWIATKRRDSSRLGYALQLTTARYPCTHLPLSRRPMTAVDNPGLRALVRQTATYEDFFRLESDEVIVIAERGATYVATLTTAPADYHFRPWGKDPDKTDCFITRGVSEVTLNDEFYEDAHSVGFCRETGAFVILDAAHTVIHFEPRPQSVAVS